MNLDFSALAEKLLLDAPSLLAQWLPAGKLNKREYVCGNIRGDAGASLSINIDSGIWRDFSTGDSGGDLISLYAAIKGIKQGEAAKELGGGDSVKMPDLYVMGKECYPIPKTKNGKPSHVFEYRNYEGVLIGYICRYEPLNEKKQFSPLTCWQEENGNYKWRWKKWPQPSPVYHAEKLKQNPDANILILEGEKKADKAQLLMPEGWIVLGWCGGAQAITKTDWGPLKNRNCWIWADNNTPGHHAAEVLKGILPDINVVTLPPETPIDWDLGDAEDGFDVVSHLTKKQSVIKPIAQAYLEKPKLPLVLGNTPTNWVTINDHTYMGVERKLMQNVMVLTESDHGMRDCLVYNIFADDIFFVKPPPWEEEKTFKVHPLREDELLNYRCWVDTRGLIVGKNDASDILTSIARRNTKNPPKEYFENLKWDNKPRLDKWLTYYLGAEEQNEHYLKLVGSKWMIAAVKRIYEPGCKFDNVLILEGDQYIGKSPSLEALATIGGERYFTDESIDFSGNKDSLMKLQGKLIFEMPELSSFRKAETNDIKAFIGRGTDEYRPPYGRKIISRPRMFVFAGSVNPIAGYLTDPTGNKRYWPVKCGKIDLAAINMDKEQLWAEAVYRYKQNEQIWLEPEEHNLAKLEQQDRMIDDIMADKIIEAARSITSTKWTDKDFSLSELVDKLNIPMQHLDGKMRLRITDCLVAHGYTEYMPRPLKGEKRMRKWKLKEDIEESDKNPPLSLAF